LVVRSSSEDRTIQASDVLVATGRAPNTAGIGLEFAGVELDQHGYVKVNDRLETTAQNVWAIGESAGDGRLIKANEGLASPPSCKLP
jgi:pyruvate/2-oxoglutarate dehydrogenase complex dihydrolipoamide dehydrogenase (E3) component